MDTEQRVAKHYTRGDLETAILTALKAGGKDIDRLAPDDLSGADEFHLGWRAATAALADDLGLKAGMQVLDVGSGIGGPARYFAGHLGCQVTGIDLTQEFVEVASVLTRRCGLSDKASFRQGSALALPFEAGSFDAATLIHVGMNIADKATLFNEARRVLKKGGRFAAYDVMRTKDGDIPYPMPWAATAETSFVETTDAYRKLLTAAGFTVEKEESRRDLALKLWREAQERQAREGPPPLGPQVLMGAEAKARIGNVIAALDQGIIAPIEMIARAV